MPNTHDKPTLQRIQRTEAYAEKVRLLFAQTVNNILTLKKQMPTLDNGTMYSFDGDSQRMQKQVEALLRQLHSVATIAIQKGIKVEWDEANNECDALIKSTYGKEVLKDTEFSAWTDRNTAAMNAFINRSDKGLNLSKKVWNSVTQLRDEMEVAMTVAIGEGDSASSMSRKIRQYLNDPDLMFRRFRVKIGEKEVEDVDADGKVIGTHTESVYGRKWKKKVKGDDGRVRWIDYDKDSYKDRWTGKGYYKSSAQNAMRVARTETNIAYRRADKARWNSLDFVLGMHIEVSHSHKIKDICDKLHGDYPKDFNFDGWHPQCFCVCTPILASWDEQKKMEAAMLKGEKYVSPNQIKDYPDSFKSWVKDNQESIASARGRGTEPYFIRDNAAVVDDILKPQSKALTIAEKAKIRHEARTPEQIQEIKERAEARQKKHAIIKKGANNILKLGNDYGEVDVTELQKYVDEGNLTKMQDATKAVAQQILAQKKAEEAISSLIPNAHYLHQSYSMNELQESYKELGGAMNKWLSKYSYTSLDDAPLEHLKNKLDFELTNPTVSYSQKEIITKALTEKIRIVNQKIEWKDLVSKVDAFKSFKTKSAIYKDCLNNLDKAIQSNDLNALQNSIAEVEKQRQRLIDKSIKRGGDLKSALNKEYRGSAVGKDISSSIDVAKMTSEDPYRGTFTNNIARIQGFDAPAKLVSVKEFEALEKVSGDVFYRTVNPTTFKGKKMSSEEFASQLYIADLLELNGPGGRAYGDGMYVATSAWDGRKIQPLSDSRKDTAYHSSVGYGNGSHTLSEMTWTRKPKIIKQSDLFDMWDKLSMKQKKAFYSENTYACALGYDGMYCDGVDYMVIWNRSIIAVKKK